MNILLSNDDGYQALGLQTLAKALIDRGDEVWICAPDQQRSGCSCAISLGKVLHFQKIGPRLACTDGQPADCVMVGLGGIYPDIAFDLVISGINEGANLGQDIFYSGTVGAAREAAFHGLKALAMSLVLDSSHQRHASKKEDLGRYESACKAVVALLNQGLAKELRAFEVLNINIPEDYKFSHLSFKEDLGLSVPGLRVYTNKILLHDGHSAAPGTGELCGFQVLGHYGGDDPGKVLEWISEGPTDGLLGGISLPWDGDVIRERKISLSLLGLWSNVPESKTYQRWQNFLSSCAQV